MPAMENPYPNRQPVVAMFPAQQGYDAAVYNIPPAVQPPPPPKWPHFKNLQGKRGGYSNKHNSRIPSTKVNINRIRKQNAQGTRGYFGQGTRTDAPRTVPPAPYNSNAYLSNQSARREGYRDSRRGRGGKKTAKMRSTHTVREQTPSTIQQTPNTLSERLCVPATEAGWTAGSDTLTSAEVAMGNNFDPLGSCMLLKKDYDTDAEENEEGSTSNGESNSDDDDDVLDPSSKAYKKLPSAVKKQLENLSGQVENLHDENKKLKERLELQASAAIADGMMHRRHRLKIYLVMDAAQALCHDGRNMRVLQRAYLRAYYAL